MVHKAERGLFELRQGRPLHVTTPQPGGSVLVAAAEGLTDELLNRLRSLDRPLRLVLTHHRGQAMGLPHGGPQRNLSLRLEEDATPASLQRRAAAQGEEVTHGHDVRPASAGETAGLGLARIGQLIPAVVSVAVDGTRSPTLARWLENDDVLDVDSEEIERILGKTGIEIIRVVEAPVPLAATENARFVF